MSNDEPFINTLRHDTAHVLAMAVQELFPDTQVTIGPVTVSYTHLTLPTMLPV